MGQWLIAFSTRENTSLDLWLTKTPRPEQPTKHERWAKRKADEASYEAAYKKEKAPPLSGLHIIPKKGRSGAPPVGDHRPPPSQKGRGGATPPAGLSQTPTDQGHMERRVGENAHPPRAGEWPRVPAPPPGAGRTESVLGMAQERGKVGIPCPLPSPAERRDRHPRSGYNHRNRKVRDWRRNNRERKIIRLQEAGGRPRAPESPQGAQKPKSDHELALEWGKLRSPRPKPKGVRGQTPIGTTQVKPTGKGPVKRRAGGAAQPPL